MATISELPISTEARKLHQESIIVDLHIDPIIQQVIFGYHLSNDHDPIWQPSKRPWLFKSVQRIKKLQKLHCPCFNHIDIPRMLKGRLRKPYPLRRLEPSQGLKAARPYEFFKRKLLSYLQ